MNKREMNEQRKKIPGGLNRNIKIIFDGHTIICGYDDALNWCSSFWLNVRLLFKWNEKRRKKRRKKKFSRITTIVSLLSSSLYVLFVIVMLKRQSQIPISSTQPSASFPFLFFHFSINEYKKKDEQKQQKATDVA